MIGIWLVVFYYSFLVGYSIVHTTLTFSILFIYNIYLKIKRQNSSINILVFLICYLLEGIVLSFNNITKSLFLCIKFKQKQKYKSTPILLVHGYTQSRLYWHLFKFRLARKQKRDIYTVDLGDDYAGIDVLAKNLKKRVDEILRETKSKKIILIGHSMGGLVSTYYTENLSKDTVKSVITISSPYFGTKLSVLVKGKNAEQMGINSRFLSNLRKKLQNSKVKYYHTSTVFDNVIIPWQSAIPNFKKRNYKIINFYGHQSFLYSPQLLNTVNNWLNKIK